MESTKRSLSDTSSDELSSKKKKHFKKKKKKMSSSGSDSDSDDSHQKHKKKKHKKKVKEEKKKLKKLEKKLRRLERKSLEQATDHITPGPSKTATVSGSSSNVMVPMTKEEWEKKQSEVTRVFDQSTGRSRLVRGSGEIIEEIVSKERQKKINKDATFADGLYYQKQTGLL